MRQILMCREEEGLMRTTWKSVVVSLTLMSAIPSFSGNAFSDWQGTAWGMSPEEADKALRIPHYQFDQGKPGGKDLKFDSYVTDDVSFKGGSLTFKDGKLSEITMYLSDGRCSDFVGVLTNTYGNPERDVKDTKNVDDTFIRDIIWNDVKSNNQINLNYLQVVKDYFQWCQLSYKPSSTPLNNDPFSPRRPLAPAPAGSEAPHN
jgi:hypothetical protein